MKINTLSSEGERQLLVDIMYIRKLLAQFVKQPEEMFDILDTIVVGLLISKRVAGVMPLEEIFE